MPAPEPIVVAIDGPSASGKSTNGRAVAAALGFIFVSTGAMYRGFAWFCLNEGVDLANTRAIGGALRRWKAALVLDEGEVHLEPKGQRRTREELEAPATASAASKISAVPAVRKYMKEIQRDCLRFGSLVMEGRDIGTNIFPASDYKFYLDASDEERDRRRNEAAASTPKKETSAAAPSTPSTDDLKARDKRDSQRAAAPLMMGLGALRIDTTGQTPEQTARMILDEVARRRSRRELRS
jgi:cytidylate kinase